MHSILSRPAGAPRPQSGDINCVTEQLVIREMGMHAELAWERQVYLCMHVMAYNEAAHPIATARL